MCRAALVHAPDAPCRSFPPHMQLLMQYQLQQQQQQHFHLQQLQLQQQLQQQLQLSAAVAAASSALAQPVWPSSVPAFAAGAVVDATRPSSFSAPPCAAEAMLMRAAPSTFTGKPAASPVRPLPTRPSVSPGALPARASHVREVLSGSAALHCAAAPTTAPTTVPAAVPKAMDMSPPTSARRVHRAKRPVRRSDSADDATRGDSISAPPRTQTVPALQQVPPARQTPLRNAVERSAAVSHVAAEAYLHSPQPADAGLPPLTPPGTRRDGPSAFDSLLDDDEFCCSDGTSRLSFGGADFSLLTPFLPSPPPGVPRAACNFSPNPFPWLGDHAAAASDRRTSAVRHATPPPQQQAGSAHPKARTCSCSLSSHGSARSRQAAAAAPDALGATTPPPFSRAAAADISPGVNFYLPSAGHASVGEQSWMASVRYSPVLHSPMLDMSGMSEQGLLAGDRSDLLNTSGQLAPPIH